MHYSTDTDGTQDDGSTGNDALISETLSEQLASLNRYPLEDESPQSADRDHFSLDELAAMSCSALQDQSLQISEVRSFLRTLLETCVSRFPLYPFDVISTLFRYPEMQQVPEEELRGLVERLEAVCREQHGVPLREPGRQQVGEQAAAPTLDQEINQLRETLKYAAIVGERLND